MEIPRGGWLAKSNLFQGKYEWNFQRGVETEKPSVVEVWIFSWTGHFCKCHDSLQMTNLVICENGELSKTELKNS